MTTAPASRTIGYIRVSTIDQCIDRQVEGMQPHCDRLYIERTSAAAKSRPEFNKALRALKKGDTFMVWDLDRAFRSTIDALKTAESLRKRGIKFRVCSLDINAISPEGEFFYTLVAAASQLERRMLSRRTREGLEAARQRGVRLGPPFLLSPKQIRKAHAQMIKHGWSLTRTAAAFNVSRMTLTRAFKREDIDFTKPP